MSQENVELVRRMWERYNSTSEFNLDSFLDDFFDVEVEYHDAPSFPAATVVHGRGALRRHVEAYLDAWAESKFEIEEIRPIGDRVLARIRYVGVGQQSGMRLADNPVTAVYDLRGGRIVRVRQFNNASKALEAVGLSG